MENSTDVEEVAPLLDRLENNIGLENITSISFDKGFSSAANKTLTESKVPTVVMPKKGKLSSAEYTRQHQKNWKHLRHQHSAVESKQIVSRAAPARG